jgi:outer membrane lipoprotein LolB
LTLGAERARLAAGLAAAALLAACTSAPPRSGLVTGQPVPDAFELSGRIAVRHAGDGYSGRLRWRHVAAQDRVELFSPMGTFYARLTRGEAGATLQTADGKRFEAEDAGALARQVLGWDLPFESLRYWLFAQAAPLGAPARLDAGPQGRPAVLEQDGWRVSYLEYAGGGASGLPSRMDLDAEGLKVRLIVSDWREPDAGSP